MKIYSQEIQRLFRNKRKKYGKYLEYYLAQNIRIKHFSVSNSANIALLLNIISDSYAIMGNQNTADLILFRKGACFGAVCGGYLEEKSVLQMSF